MAHHAESAVDEGGEECYAPMWEVGGAHACHFPAGGLEWGEVEFVGEESVFVAEGVEVGVFGAVGVLVEESGLSEEEGFDG